MSGIIDKVLRRRSSEGSSPPTPSSPSTKESKERHKKLSQSLQAAIDNSAKSEVAGNGETDACTFLIC